MGTVEEATAIILQNCFVPSPVSVPVTSSVGRVLAEQVRADRDFPPFDRVAMDGIAISFSAWEQGRREFIIEDLQAAGQGVKKLRNDANAMEVMTGAILPEGTDTVIRYEDLKITREVAVILIVKVIRGQNIHRQAQDAKAGEVLLEPGTMISPAETALLSSVGLSRLDVLDFPKTAIISSGDELVDIDTKPEPHQVRRSNSYAVHASMKSLQWPGSIFHLPDNREFLKSSLSAILADHQVMILSGGISKGKFDFIPEVLEAIGVQQLIREVSQRPGKPFWFGATKDHKVVFALPGNPVSTFMCFHRYIKPWLLKSFGLPRRDLKVMLAADLNFEPRLTYFLQVRVSNDEGRLVAYPHAGGGSGDFANLKNVDGFLELPMEKSVFKAGEVYPFIPFR